jgi:crotonobetainyl-CoA:carnitine CoA-transferase CaiB-like acyl-CoA transferase
MSDQPPVGPDVPTAGTSGGTVTALPTAGAPARAPQTVHQKLVASVFPVVAAFATNNLRVANRALVRTAIEAWSGTLPTSEVVARLADDVPCGPINDVAAIFADEHARMRNMLVEVAHPGSALPVTIAGSPIKFAGQDARPYRRAPLLGEHTDDVLAMLGEPREGTASETAPQ